MRIRFQDGNEVIELERGEEPAIDKVLGWLQTAAKIPSRFPRAQAAYDALVDTRGHVDAPPDKEGK